MSRHCTSYGAYLKSSCLSHTHCIKTPSMTASVDCDQASQIDGSVFCGFHSYHTFVKVSHCILQMLLLPQRQIVLAWEIHASGVLHFLLDRTVLWVGGLRKVGIDLQLRHIGLHRVAWLQ